MSAGNASIVADGETYQLYVKSLAEQVPECLPRIIHEGTEFSRNTNAPVWYKGCADNTLATTEALAWCFRHQLLLPRPYLVLTKPLRLDIQCQRGASVKIGWKYLDD